MDNEFDRDRVYDFNDNYVYHSSLLFYHIIQTIFTLVLYYNLKKNINFSFLFSGINLFFYCFISITLFIQIFLIVNFIHFFETKVHFTFILTFIVFKGLELFFLFFISQYVYSKYIYYIYISICISLFILSYNILGNDDRFKTYLITIVIILILNNFILFIFYISNYFDIKLLNYLIFTVLYSIFLFLFFLIYYKLIINHLHDKTGLYYLFSVVLIYFAIFIILFEKMGAKKIIPR